jgi:hypothetical protein
VVVARCIALLLLAAEGPGVSPEGQAGVAGGYESNVTLAPVGSPQQGSPLLTAWAGLGASWDPGEATVLSAELRYDGTWLPSASDLDRNSAGLDLLWFQEAGEAVAIVVGAGGAWSWYADPARSGPGVAARATVRVKPLPWLALRAGYAYSGRWAEYDVYSTSLHRIQGGAEARLASGVYLGLAYAWQAGRQTFYAQAPAVAAVVSPAFSMTSPAPGGRGSGSGPGPVSPPAAGTSGGQGSGTGSGPQGPPPPGSGAFETLVPYLASTTDSTLTPTFEAALWEGLYAFGSYSYTWGSSDEGAYDVHSGVGGIGYRF